MVLFNYRGLCGYPEWDDEALIYYGRIINSGKDVITFWGETLNDAKVSFMESVDDYLLFCETIGRQCGGEQH